MAAFTEPGDLIAQSEAGAFPEAAASAISDAYRLQAIDFLRKCESLTRSTILLLEQNPLDHVALIAISDAHQSYQEAAGQALMAAGATFNCKGMA